MNITQGKYRPIELLRYAGMFLWFCAGIPLPFMHVIYPQPLSLELYVAWIMLHLLNNNRLAAVVAGGVFLLIAAGLVLRVDPAHSEPHFEEEAAS